MYLGYINSVLNPLIYDMDFKLFFNFFADSRFGHFWTSTVESGRSLSVKADDP